MKYLMKYFYPEMEKALTVVWVVLILEFIQHIVRTGSKTTIFCICEMHA